MKLFEEIALNRDYSEKGLYRGDLATIVDVVTAEDGTLGYLLEVFNALGDTVGVVTVRATDVEPLRADEVLAVRQVTPPVPSERLWQE